MIKKIINIFTGKEIKNALWLIVGKVIQMLLAFFIGILSARYLGPSNYGLINYGTSYVAFFTAFCTLGINSIIVNEFLNNPSDQGTALGTTFVFRLCSSFISVLLIGLIVFVLDFGETETIIVVIMCAFSLVFMSFDTINYWFQAKYCSKVTAVCTLIAYTVTSLYKVVLLICNKSVLWFAISTSVDYIVLAVLLLIFYHKYNGPKLHFSFDKGKRLLKNSYHFILASMMVAIYGQTDKLMIKQMLGAEDVGYYSIASTICMMWVFILQAIIDSIYPTIITLHKNKDYENYRKKNRQLYAIVFYISVIASFLICIFANIIIKTLYGTNYMDAAKPLRIITWYTAFSFLGVARGAWLVCENCQKYLKYMYIGSALANVILNFILIPLYGTEGAAVASLVTQICSCFIMPFMFKDTRENAKLMISGILFKDIF